MWSMRFVTKPAVHHGEKPKSVSPEILEELHMLTMLSTPAEKRGDPRPEPRGQRS